jgi:hypothetical protein
MCLTSLERDYLPECQESAVLLEVKWLLHCVAGQGWIKLFYLRRGWAQHASGCGGFQRLLIDIIYFVACSAVAKFTQGLGCALTQRYVSQGIAQAMSAAELSGAKETCGCATLASLDLLCLVA